MGKNGHLLYAHKIGLVLFLLLFCLIDKSFCENNEKHINSLKRKAVSYYWGRGVGQDLRKALQLYEQAGELGDPGANFIAGGMYYTGKGTPKNLRKAFMLLKEATEGGVETPDSNQALAQLYLAGNVVPQNYDEAVKLYKKAAESGKKEAQNELGYLYYTGKGIENDYEKAFYWFKAAAVQGLAVAQYNIAMMYYTGDVGTGVDLVKSCSWFNVASAYGHPGAKNARTFIETLLSEEEYKDAYKLTLKLHKMIKVTKK